MKEATTTKDGEVTASLPEGTKQVQVILFVNERPDFEAKYPSPLFYDFQVEDDLHAASDLQGARIRLRNLGYTPGTDLDVKDPKDDPLTTHEYNVTGTLNVLLAAKEAGVRRVVYAASSSASRWSPSCPVSAQREPRPGRDCRCSPRQRPPQAALNSDAPSCCRRRAT
mgnify:CR=1 FL=1